MNPKHLSLVHAVKMNPRQHIFVVAVLILGATTSPRVLAVIFQYGQHFPNGDAAVAHAYSSSTGTWKRMAPITYVWNYYEQYATPSHPFDKGALIAAANGSAGAFYTTRDANGYLFCDHDYDLEVDSDLAADCGYAFHEHNGIGVNGSRRGAPFTNFWLDDNWLARYMSQAYKRPEPSGLSDQSGFMRWKPIGGDPTNWVLYISMHFDTLALDGLYYIAMGEFEKAVVNWNTSVAMSEAFYDDGGRVFVYPNIEENYHVGLFKILTEQLLVHVRDSFEGGLVSLMLQHSVGLHAHILGHQQRDSETGVLLGWTSHVDGGGSLINTESISCNVLALGAGAKYVAEVKPGMDDDGNPLATVKLLLSGLANYTAEFLIRSSRPVDGIGSLRIQDITDGAFAKILGYKILRKEDFYGPDVWTSVRMNFGLPEDQVYLVEFIARGGSLGVVDTSVIKIYD